MTSPTASESSHRFRDILSLVSREPIRTAYEVAARLQLPISSTYLAVAELERLSCLARDESGYLLLGMLPQQAALNALGYEISAHAYLRWFAICVTKLVKQYLPRTCEAVGLRSGVLHTALMRQHY